MNKHEKLKIICDKIGYTGKFLNKYGGMLSFTEIIFTQEFMNKYRKYYDIHGVPIKDFFNASRDEWEKLDSGLKNDIFQNQFNNLIRNNLDNPVDYLYNLLGLGKTE